MKKEEINRLLEEGLKNYSRVQPPGGLAARVRERIARVPQRSPAGARRWRFWLPAAGARRWRFWLPAAGARRWRFWLPATVAALLALVAWWPQTGPVPPPPIFRADMRIPDQTWRIWSDRPISSPPAVLRTPRGAEIAATRRPKSSIKVLSPEELAGLQLSGDMFPKERPPERLAIPELSIRDLSIPALESINAEPQGSSSNTERE